MARDPKADPYYNPEFSPEVNEVTNDFVYKKTGKQTTGDAIIVRPRGGSFDVLLIERKRGPHQGGLALPGGFKEGADSVEDFVAREALEETGLTNKDIKETIDLPTKTDRFDWDVRFADGVDVSGKIFIVDDSFIPKAGDDAVSAKFVPVEDIASGKVDIAFLHSEWIYDTSQKLDSNYSGTSELQEIVAKDRKRNIDFMQEINTKRAIDNQPLMTGVTPEVKSRIVPKGTPDSVLAMRGGPLGNPFGYWGGTGELYTVTGKNETEKIAKVVELHKNWLETGELPNDITPEKRAKFDALRKQQLKTIDNLPNNYKLGYYKPDAPVSHAITLENFIEERRKGRTSNNTSEIKFNKVAESGYLERTRYNGQNSDITFDFSKTSSGSGATKKYAGDNWNWVGINNNGLMTGDKNKLANVIAENLLNGKTVNIAGHGNYKSPRGGLTAPVSQSVIDNELIEVMQLANNKIGDKTVTGKIISGGQTGFDEAGVKAANMFGIPTEVNYSGIGLYRDATGTDINDYQKFTQRFNTFGPGSLGAAQNIISDMEVKNQVDAPSNIQNYSLKGLDFLGKAVAPIDEALELGIPKLLANTAAAPFAQSLVKVFRQLTLANLGIAVTKGLYESEVMGENYQNLLKDPDNPEYIAERERLNQEGIQAFSDHMSTYDPSIRFIDKVTEEKFGFNQSDAAIKVYDGIKNLFRGGRK